MLLCLMMLLVLLDLRKPNIRTQHPLIGLSGKVTMLEVGLILEILGMLVLVKLRTGPGQDLSQRTANDYVGSAEKKGTSRNSATNGWRGTRVKATIKLKIKASQL